jgi:folate-dependent phosphoribosylglycinamide formyltransferase PurN
VKVVALCGAVGKAATLDMALRHDDELEVHFLLPNVLHRPRPLFLLRTFAQMALAGPRGWIWVALRLLQRRVIITRHSLEDPALLRRLDALQPDVGLHAVGVIYRDAVLECFRIGILNAHIGLLPKYRGRSVMEWSLLNGDPTGVTTFFVDEGIDTGARIVTRREVDVSGFRSVSEAKRYLFSLDREMYAEALELLRRRGFVPLRQEPSEGVRWYAMSRLLTGVVDDLLNCEEPRP